MTFGKVYLVGAGPGAADLITLRAARILRQADVLLFDRLANPEIMDFASPKAERIHVGKLPGKDSDTRQNRIFALMIGHARAGKTVVRLKGGDPFVFGRGGEEMLQLQQAGIEAEIVPGISSAIAAPGSAKIPVTFRGLSNSFAVFTAHPGDGLAEPDWSAAATIGTAIFLMGVDRLPMIVSHMLGFGRPLDTPVAVIERATWEDQRTVTGTLADIVEKTRHIVRPPATIIVGAVAGIHTHSVAMALAEQVS